MKEKEVKKRAWVKNAVIVFLAILVVLTFLSNTIMNRAFPEVAARHAEPGTITARVRGSNPVVANESRSIYSTQTRMVRQVIPRVGAEVSVGDVLILFYGTESGDLDDAREALHELEFALERMIARAENSGDEELVTLRRAVQKARDDLSAAQRERNAIPFDPDALNNANAALPSLLEEKTRREAEAIPLREEVEERGTEVTRLRGMVENRRGAVESVEDNLRDLRLQLTFDPDNPVLQVNAALAETARDVARERLRAEQAAVTTAEQALSNAREALALVETALQNVENSIKNAEEIIETQGGFQKAIPPADEAVREAQRALDFANEDLALAQRDDPVLAIDIEEQEGKIERQREVVEELERDGTGSEITSPVNGIVTSITRDIIGNPTSADIALMVIEVVDSGYSLSFTATAEQAARLTIGDNAEVTRDFWSDGDIRAVLTGIRNDPEDPTRMRRLLVFDIIGDVDSGEQLTITINQRSENYSTIVPNSALRSDTNGNFVLVVDSRPSPLGNRYVAVRADINIITSDDTHTAVSGALAAWDFVITTSSAPVEPGMQVRLADN